MTCHDLSIVATCDEGRCVARHCITAGATSTWRSRYDRSSIEGSGWSWNILNASKQSSQSQPSNDGSTPPGGLSSVFWKQRIKECSNMFNQWNEQVDSASDSNSFATVAPKDWNTKCIRALSPLFLSLWLSLWHQSSLTTSRNHHQVSPVTFHPLVTQTIRRHRMTRDMRS